MCSLLQFYRYINNEIADVRTRDWTLLTSPIPIIIITFSYLYFVLKCGPRYMENKVAYSCLRFIKFYNIFQIVANSFVVYHIIENGWFRNIWLRCVKIAYTTDPTGMKYASIAWWFMCLKLIDYSETCVFVLRKKQQQVTFLHVYHHVTIVVFTWYQAKYYANAPIMTAVIVNAAVHVIMYTYYLLSSMGPTIQRYTNYIKPTITRIQMTQFVFIATYALCYILLCGSPRVPTMVLMFLVASNYILFSNFYKRTYREGNKQK